MIGGSRDNPDEEILPAKSTDIVARLDFATDGTSTWSQVGRINQARTNKVRLIFLRSLSCLWLSLKLIHVKKGLKLSQVTLKPFLG